MTASAATAQAADETPAQVAWATAERAVTAHYVGSDLVIESQRVEGSFQDRIVARLDPTNVSVDVSYQNLTRGNSTRTDFRLETSRLIEYRDLDGDGRLDLSDDFVTRIPLDDIATGSLTDASVPGGGHTAVLSVPLGDGPGHLDLRLVMMPETWTMDDRAVRPTELALEYTLVAFRYTEPDTRVALITYFEAPSDLARDVRGGDGFSFVRRGAQGFYEWSPNATAASANLPVGTTAFEIRLTPNEETGGVARRGVAAFSYERTSSPMRHAVILGIAQAPPTEGVVQVVIEAALHGDWRIYTLGIGIAMLLVLATTAATLRRRSA